MKWIVTLLTIFQTKFFFTKRALNRLLRVLTVLLSFLGRYSLKIAELAATLPQTMHQYNHSLSIVIYGGTFERQAVCRACNSLYKFEECLVKVGSRTVTNHCVCKLFKRTCNEPLIKGIISSNVHRKFYPHAVFCSQV